ncbi:ABC transporter substrate-binding protein [Variovorax sp. UMC13]|uniref:ABC transporter substrate-binding protein n=1 Tax=Variovorax sp. UMC13 TaxID=1862326 RepID=UPI0016003405|nr:ABC transporter substrate-binding protein [Variovorax sp. UMC13]MBB1598474.1 hypothetical protein [Variovorax sp. UMC13]
MAAPLLWTRRASAAQRVVLRSSGGSYDEIRKKLIYEPFQKQTGIEVVVVAANIAKMLAMMKAGGGELDAIDVGADAVYQLEASGGLAPIPYDRFSFTRPDDIGAPYRRQYLVGNHVFSRVLGFNTAALPAGREPSSWADFWDTRNFPGARTLADMVTGAPDLEFALLADGVPMDKIYPIDLDRAFASLSKIRPSIPKFWDSGGLGAQMLADKQVVMGSIWNPRLEVMAKSGVPVKAQWNQNMIQLQSYALVKGARNMDAAVKLIDYCVSAEVQQRFSENYAGTGPVNTRAMNALPAALRDTVPGNPRLADKSFLLDPKWWADNRTVVNDRWSKWIVKA